MNRRPKQKGLRLATEGLALTVAVLFLLHAIRFIEVTPREWAVTAAAAFICIGGSWALLQFGARLWSRWDPHFVLVPTTTVALLLSSLIWAAAEVRHLILVIWPVVLIFLAGYVTFTVAAALSALMTVGYMAAVWLARPVGFRPGAELILAGIFLVINLFAGVVLGRIRRQRLALAGARAELAHLVNVDHLTGLPNRRHFSAMFEAEMARVNRYGGSFSLGMLDVDHFKDYNDRHGHPAGDDVLRELAQLLREQLRASDSMARLGGEEFAVLMVGADKATAERVAERIRSQVAEHRFGAEGRTLTVSIGVAAAPEDAVEPEVLLRLSDQALYAAKAAGRNRVVLTDVGREPVHSH